MPPVVCERRESGKYRANCGSVAGEDYTLARRRLARPILSAPESRERVIVADIYTLVTLPVRLRDSSQDLSVDPAINRVDDKMERNLGTVTHTFPPFKNNKPEFLSFKRLEVGAVETTCTSRQPGPKDGTLVNLKIKVKNS